MLRNIDAIKFEISMLEGVFGKNNVFWPENYEFVIIKNLPLPNGYNFPNTNCLIEIPEGYGFGHQRLEDFYVRKGLLYKGKSLPHYFNTNVHKKKSFEADGWYWLCIKPDTKSPNNFLMFIKQVELFLKYPFNERLS